MSAQGQQAEQGQMWTTGSNIPGYLPDVDTSDDVMTWGEVLTVYRAGIDTLVDDLVEVGGEAWAQQTQEQAQSAIPDEPAPFYVTLTLPDGWARAYYVERAEDDPEDEDDDTADKAYVVRVLRDGEVLQEVRCDDERTALAQHNAWVTMWQQRRAAGQMLDETTVQVIDLILNDDNDSDVVAETTVPR